MPKRRGRGFWLRLVRAYERSGLQQRTFCSRHGVSLGTFQHWLYRLRKEEQTASANTALVKVE